MVSSLSRNGNRPKTHPSVNRPGDPSGSDATSFAPVRHYSERMESEEKQESY